MNDVSFPPRLHALIARDQNVAIVIRRGPSKQVATFLWNLDKDNFKIGQWLKGRIYERRCDISRDGKHFLYFAMTDKRSNKAAATWTALSRMPYLKALDFYPKGDAWEGGGIFLNNKEYFLNDRYYHKHKDERRTSGLQCLNNMRAKHAHGAECLSIYFPRLIKEGWELIEHQNNIAIFEKTLGDWVLRKIAHAGTNTPDGKGCYWDEHILNYKKKLTIDGANWEWADFDKKTVVFAEKGCLFRAKISADFMAKPKKLIDFSKHVFEPIRAPY